jgi:hypothetical protein
MNEEQEKLIGREFRHFKGNLYRLEGNEGSGGMKGQSLLIQ